MLRRPVSLLRHLGAALLVLAALGGAAHAQLAGSPPGINGPPTPIFLAVPPPGSTLTPLGTAANPIYVTGGGGGGGGGTVTQGPGSSASPWSVFAGQYNSTLPAFASGTSGYLSMDAAGRLSLAPASTIGVTGSVTATQGPPNAGGTQAWSVSDPNNAGYSIAGLTFATGTTVTPGRGIYLNCPGPGTVTLVLSGGGSIAYQVTQGSNQLSYSVSQVSADTASCTHQITN